MVFAVGGICRGTTDLLGSQRRENGNGYIRPAPVGDPVPLIVLGNMTDPVDPTNGLRPLIYDLANSPVFGGQAPVAGDVVLTEANDPHTATSDLLRFTSQGLLVIYSDLPEPGELNGLADVGIPMLRQSNIVTLVEASLDGFPGYTPTAEQPGFIVLAPFPSTTYDFIGNLPEPRVPMEPGAWLAIRFMSRPRWRRRQTNARRRRPAAPWHPVFSASDDSPRL